VLNEIERNLQVARNVVFEPLLLPGGGATEMRIAHELKKRALQIEGVEQYPFKAVSEALEVIPRTLLQNCGADVVRVMTVLRAKQAETDEPWGVDGVTGKISFFFFLKENFSYNNSGRSIFCNFFFFGPF
jgi:T-complex protein 1 subunit gamma